MKLRAIALLVAIPAACAPPPAPRAVTISTSSTSSVPTNTTLQGVCKVPARPPLRALPALPPAYARCYRDCVALGRAIGGTAEIPALKEELRSPEKHVRVYAYDTIRNLGPAGRGAIPDVLAAFARHGDDEAVWVIGESSDPAAAAAARLAQRRQRDFDHPFPRAEALRIAATAVKSGDVMEAERSLWQTVPDPTDEAGLPALLASTEADVRAVQSGATGYVTARLPARISAIGALGPYARSAIPLLRELAGASDEDLAKPAREALWHVDDETRLRASLRHAGDPRTVDRAAHDLAPFGVRARAAIPALVDRLRRSPFEVEPEVAFALASLGGPEVITPLIEALSVPRAPLAAAAARALGELGATACEALPALHAAREHWSFAVRWEVARSIAALEGVPIDPAPFEEPRRKDLAGLMEIATAPIDAAHEAQGPSVGCLDEAPILVGDACVGGADVGEWGGRLFSLPRGSTLRPPDLITKTDHGIKALYPWPDGAIAVSGTDHMALDSGNVLRVHRDAMGWHVADVFELPSYPQAHRRAGRELVVAANERVLGAPGWVAAGSRAPPPLASSARSQWRTLRHSCAGSRPTRRWRSVAHCQMAGWRPRTC